MTDSEAVVVPFEKPAQRAERERQEDGKRWIDLIRAELREAKSER